MVYIARRGFRSRAGCLRGLREKTYPRDYTEPSFLFGWGLLHAFFGRDTESIARYRAAILKNIYIAPMLLEQPAPPSRTSGSRATAPRSLRARVHRILRRAVGSHARRTAAAARGMGRVRGPDRGNRRAAQEMFEFQDQRYEPDYKRLWLNSSRRTRGSRDSYCAGHRLAWRRGRASAGTAPRAARTSSRARAKIFRWERLVARATAARERGLRSRRSRLGRLRLDEAESQLGAQPEHALAFIESRLGRLRLLRSIAIEGRALPRDDERRRQVGRECRPGAGGERQRGEEEREFKAHARRGLRDREDTNVRVRRRVCARRIVPRPTRAPR